MYAYGRSRVRIGKGFSKEFEVKVGVHQGSMSVPCFSSLCWRPCHVSFGLVFPWRTYMHHCLLPRGMCLEGFDMERSHREEGVDGKCRKDKGHDLWYRPGPQSSGEYPCAVCWTGVGNNSIYCTANFGCIRNAVGYNDWHQILIIGVHGAWEMLDLLTAGNRIKSRSNLISWMW